MFHLFFILNFYILFLIFFVLRNKHKFIFGAPLHNHIYYRQKIREYCILLRIETMQLNSLYKNALDICPEKILGYNGKQKLF